MMDQRVLRVLLVTPRYYPYMGGVETHVHEMARRFAAKGIDTTILTTDPSKRLPTEEFAEGVHLIRVPAYPAERDYYFAPQVYKVVTQGNWDIVHCQGFHTLVPPLAMLAAKVRNIPYMLSFHSGGHSSELRNSMRWLQAKINQPLLAGAQKLIAVSQFEADLFQERLGLPAEKFTVIPNGSNFAPIDPASVAQDPDLIISVGRLERYKGHHRLIEAMPFILKQRPNAHLRILGTGPYEEPLYRLARDLGVADQTEIGSISPKDRTEMAKTLASAALVTLLSDYEAHPLAVMEALSMRRPVLVADTSGLSELAERGWVRAIPVESSPMEVADAVVRELQSPMAVPAVKLPTWDDCAVSLMSLYRSFTENRLPVLA